jgi:hypothetical protein
MAIKKRRSDRSGRDKAQSPGRPPASRTHMTTPWPKRSTACPKPKSSTAVAHGAALKPSNRPPSNETTGSTTAVCWNPLGISRPQKPKQTLCGSGKIRHGRVTKTNQPPANSARFTSESGACSESRRRQWRHTNVRHFNRTVAERILRLLG